MIRRNSKSDIRGGQKATIRLLDDSEVIQVDFQPHHKGQYLMDYVCRQLNIAEKDYFGLRYVDGNKQRHWLDLNKTIIRQLKEMTPYIICFRIKFYPADPTILKEEITRYQLVLQLRRDILHGRLYSNVEDMATLVSYILQSELGDYDPEVHKENYISEYELVSRQTPELEEKAQELHQKLNGLTPEESDILFLKKALTLDTYGIDPHPVKDQQGEQVYLGFNHTGIQTFQGTNKSTHFKWPQVAKINFEGKMFILHLSMSEDSRNKKKETVGFKCQSSSACKHLWKCAVEQRLFYTIGCAGEIPIVRGGGIFFGSKFRYSGRVQREILEDPGPLRAVDGVTRTPLYRSLQRNKSGTNSLPHSPLGYGSLPRNHSGPQNESTRIEGISSSTSLPLSTISSPYASEHNPLLETLNEGDTTRDGESKLASVSEENEYDPKESELILRLSDSGGTAQDNINTTSIWDGKELEGEVQDDFEGGDTNNEVLGEFLDTIQEEDGGGGGGGGSGVSEVGKGRERKLGMVGNGSILTLDPTIISKHPLAKEESEKELEQISGTPEKSEENPQNNNNISSDELETLLSSQQSNNSNEGSNALMASYQGEGEPRSKSGQMVSVWRIFMVCLTCVLIALLVFAIIAIEVDVDMTRRMRRIPEIELFQHEIYDPVKIYLRNKMRFLGLR